MRGCGSGRGVERLAPIMIRYGGFDHRGIRDLVHGEMPAKKFEILWKRFEAVHVPSVTAQNAGEKSIEAGVCSNVVDDIAGRDCFGERGGLLIFVTPEPTPKRARTYDPFLSTERTLQNGQHG